jgi:hypothetical protein
LRFAVCQHGGAVKVVLLPQQARVSFGVGFAALCASLGIPTALNAFEFWPLTQTIQFRVFRTNLAAVSV